MQTTITQCLKRWASYLDYEFILYHSKETIASTENNSIFFFETLRFNFLFCVGQALLSYEDANKQIFEGLFFDANG